MAGRPKGNGKTPGSGREKGTPNKRTVEVLDALRASGHDPEQAFLFLAKVVGGTTKFKTTVTDAEGVAKEVDISPTLDQRITAARELAQYIAPKRKAVELAGVDGKDLPATPLLLSFEGSGEKEC